MITSRYLTNFSVVFLAHAFLILGGWQIASNESVVQSFKDGIKTIKVKMSSPGGSSVRVAPRPSPRPLMTKTTSSVKSLPVPQINEQSAAATAVSQSSSTQGTSVYGTPDGELADAKTLFKHDLRAKIEENKFYPPMSRRLGQTGTVIVAFTLLDDGHIIDVRIDKPSRFELLNESALAAVKKVHKFRPIPREWGESRMDVRVPLKFYTI